MNTLYIRPTFSKDFLKLIQFTIATHNKNSILKHQTITTYDKSFSLDEIIHDLKLKFNFNTKILSGQIISINNVHN